MKLPHLRLRSRQRFTALAAAAAAFVTVVPAGTASAAAAPPAEQGTTYLQQSVVWSECISAQPGVAALECATITVPRDWAKPNAGPTLDVAISRVRATDTAHRKGILFTNPGGPGGPGRNLPYGVAQSQPSVAAVYDVIGMDPRGVGDGRPGASTALNCDVELAPVLAANGYDSRDLSDAAVAARQALAKAVADGCARNPLTAYVNTWQTAHDVDLIRALLGESKLNYLGYSYGTWLGAKYTALFPAHAGKMILDSNTSWMDSLSASWELMPMAFQRRWAQQFLPWTVRSPAFSKYLGTTTAQVNTAYEQSRAAYIKYKGDVTAGTTIDGLMAQSLYTDSGFLSNAVNLAYLKTCLVDNTDWSRPAVDACRDAFFDNLNRDLDSNASARQSLTTMTANASALLLDPSRSADLRDPVQSLMAAASHATGPTIQTGGVYSAVRCGDGGQWHSPSWWANFERKTTPAYPLAVHLITGMEVCSSWTAPTQKLPNPRNAGPIVTVQSEFDPATAYENTNRNVAQYRDARLVAVDDAGAHGQYAFRGNGCVDEIVNGWLLNDVVPQTRTVCGATPLPLETVVFPEPGPVDSKSRPRSVHATVFNPHLQALLESIIGSTS